MDYLGQMVIKLGKKVPKASSNVGFFGCPKRQAASGYVDAQGIKQQWLF